MPKTAQDMVLHMAMELSNTKWRLGFQAGNRRRFVSFEARDLRALDGAIASAKVKLGAAGLTGTPFDSGDSEREQGISKAGNALIRAHLLPSVRAALRCLCESRHLRRFLGGLGDLDGFNTKKLVTPPNLRGPMREFFAAR